MPRISFRILVGVILLFPVASIAQPGDWSNAFAGAGVDDHVHVIDASETLVCMAGAFRYAGGKAVSTPPGSACYDVRTQTWEVLPVTGHIRSISVNSADAIFIGGENLKLEGDATSGLLMRNNHGSWIDIGKSIGATVEAITATSTGEVFVASEGRLFRLDTINDRLLQFGAIDNQASSYVSVLSLSDNNRVHIGGRFNTVQANDTIIHTNNIAEYDIIEDSWTSLGSGLYRRLSQSVNGIDYLPDGTLVAIGSFSGAIQPDGDTLSVGSIAQWAPENGGGWARYGHRDFSLLSDIAISDRGIVYVVDYERLWRSDGRDWIQTGTDIIQRPTNPRAPTESIRIPNVLAIAGNNVFIGMMWMVRNSDIAPNSLLYTWTEEDDIENGTIRLPLVSDRKNLGFDGGIAAVALDIEGQPAAAGEFSFAGSTMAGIARLENETWTNLGFAEGRVQHLRLTGDGDIIAAGDFEHIENVSGTSNVARFNNKLGLWQPLDGGVTGKVEDIVTGSGGQILIAGSFSRVGSHQVETPSIAVYDRSLGWDVFTLDDFHGVTGIAYNERSGEVFIAGWTASDGDLTGRIERRQLDHHLEVDLLDEWANATIPYIGLSYGEGGAVSVFALDSDHRLWQYVNDEKRELGEIASPSYLTVVQNQLYVSNKRGDLYMREDDDWTLTATIDGQILSVDMSDELLAVSGEFSRIDTGHSIIASANIAINNLSGGVNPSSQSNTAMPFSFDLYPLPASHNATIGLNLNTSEVTTVAIYDIRGRIIQKRMLGMMPAGRHERILDFSTMASGLYFIAVIIDGERTVRPLVVVK